MSTHPAAKSALALVVAGALLLAGGALYLSITQGDPISPLFRHVLTIEVMAALVVWFTAAWTARRFTVGRLPKLRLGSAGLLWGGSRVALLIATALLLIGWLAALALGIAVQTAFLRAAVLLVVVTAFTGSRAEHSSTRYWPSDTGASKRPNDGFPPVADTAVMTQVRPQ